MPILVAFYCNYNMTCGGMLFFKYILYRSPRLPAKSLCGPAASDGVWLNVDEAEISTTLKSRVVSTWYLSFKYKYKYKSDRQYL